MNKLIAVLPLLCLAGCYTSERELVSAKQAVFPYKKIVYQPSDSDKPVTLVRTGSAYVATSDAKPPESFELRFMPIRGSLYAAQLKGMEGKKAQYLYAVVKFDPESKSAESFEAVASKDDQGPNLRPCNKTGTDICLTSLQPYLVHALASIATGEKPSDTYKILTLEP